jgi:hypothetical protein
MSSSGGDGGGGGGLRNVVKRARETESEGEWERWSDIVALLWKTALYISGFMC